MNSQRIEREEDRSAVFYFGGQESPCQPPAKHLTVAIRHLGAEIVPFGATFVTKTGIASKIKNKDSCLINHRKRRSEGEEK